VAFLNRTLRRFAESCIRSRGGGRLRGGRSCFVGRQMIMHPQALERLVSYVVRSC
jgi:hypothetical protein